jgi:hypothetical protein
VPSDWSAAGLSGRRRRTAWSRSRRRSWPIYSKALTGATRYTAGVRTRLDRVRQVDSPIAREHHNSAQLWLNRAVPITSDILPDAVDALQTALIAERPARQQAEARAPGAEAMVAHLKLVIAKLRRERFGPSAERGSKLLDQLEELEASATEDALAATTKPVQDETAVPSFTRQKRVRAPFPAHLPRERVVIPAPAACPCCGGKLAKLGEDVTETLEVVPRQWKAVQTIREKFTCRSCEKTASRRHPSTPSPAGRPEPACWR